MRKSLFCIFLAVVLSAAMLTGCASPTDQPGVTPDATKVPDATSAPAPTVEAAQETPSPVATEAPQDTAEEPYAGYNEYIAPMYDAMAERAEEYAPRIVTLDNGVQVQRTPTEYYMGVYHNPGETMGFNNFYLKSDSRGCAACHSDLAQLLIDMEYEHCDLTNPFGVDLTVTQCLDCHTYAPGYLTDFYQFGSLMHMIHTNDEFDTMGGNCWSCHNGTADGNGMQLWDEAKYDVLRGIVELADVTGEFSYVQDKIIEDAEMYNYNWMYYYDDYTRNAADAVNAPYSDELFESWPIKVTGNVENPYETTLGELIKEGASVTTTMTMHCTMNPVGGSYIANCEVVGIPVSYILDKAGVKEDSTVLAPYAADGFCIYSSMEHISQHEAYLVYEINGDRLTHLEGYPCQLWIGGMPASSFIKQMVTFEVQNNPVEDYHFYIGWEKEDEGYFNLPNVCVTFLKEGQIIDAGKPYTFEGWADAFNQNVTAVEFSMDGGDTWTSYSTEGANPDRWIYWNWTFTPEEPGAYVLKVRAVTDQGYITDDPYTIMVNAK